MDPHRPNAELSDEALLARIAAGDAEAFSSFYDRHAPLLYSIAYRILNQDSEAQDAVQDALVLIWERAAAFDPGLGKPLSWAVTLTRNKAVDRLRAMARRGHVALESPEGAPVAEMAVADETPAKASVSLEVARAVLGALSKLSREQQQAIELAFLGGLSQTEVAERLGEPLGTVKARIRRGMLQLREVLAPHRQT